MLLYRDSLSSFVILEMFYTLHENWSQVYGRLYGVSVIVRSRWYFGFKFSKCEVTTYCGALTCHCIDRVKQYHYKLAKFMLFLSVPRT